MADTPPSKPKLKRRYIRYSIPGEAGEILDDFIRRLGFYVDAREFSESLCAYSLWCERVHHLTGPSFNTQEARRKMWEEIIADYGKPNKSGSFFEHRLEEIAAARSRKKT